MAQKKRPPKVRPRTPARVKKRRKKARPRGHLLGRTGSLIVGVFLLIAAGLLLTGASLGALLRRGASAARRAPRPRRRPRPEPQPEPAVPRRLGVKPVDAVADFPEIVAEP